MHKQSVALVLLVAVGCSGHDSVRPKEETLDPTSIALSHSALTFVALGESIQVQATVRDQNGHPLPGQPMAWSSSDPSVAKVIEGLVTAMGNGSADIIASSGSLSASATVTVSQVPASLTLSRDTATLTRLGDTVRVTATVFDRGGSVVEGFNPTWSSEDDQVVTASEGLLRAVGEGRTVVWADAGSVRAQVEVAVADLQGRIVFTAGGYSPEIGINVTGAPEWIPTRISPEGEFDRWPTWSPDGSRIAFVGWSTGEVHVMNADGSNRVKITNLDIKIEDLAWSPDGTKIAFAEFISGAGHELVVVASDGSNRIRLTHFRGGVEEPSWVR